MRESTITCSKCRGQMETGTIVDHTVGGKVVSSWLSGSAELGLMGSLKTWGKECQRGRDRVRELWRHPE